MVGIDFTNWDYMVWLSGLLKGRNGKWASPAEEKHNYYFIDRPLG